MSYISADLIGDTVLVWERGPAGREVKQYRAPYYFFIEDPEGDHTSIFGNNLTKLTFRNSAEYRRARQDCESSGIEMYESDVSPIERILSQHYYGAPAPTLHITLLDIEVDYHREIGFASVDNPYAPINSIAMYHTWQKRYVVYAVPPKEGKWIEDNGVDFDKTKFIKDLEGIAPIKDGTDFEIHFCKDEKELLMHVLVELEDSDLTCGWNSDFFDIPYIGKRLEKLGKRYFRMLEFPEGKEPKYRAIEKFGNEHWTLDTTGRIKADYLALFQKYEMAERPSYKLEAIADEIVPELPKLKYEGTLADLYRNDFLMFVRYNLRDTEILEGFEEKLGYIALAIEMYHISTGLFNHVGGTLKLAELAINNYCVHELGLRFPNRKEPSSTGSIQGAYVLEPKKGKHDWIGSIDINSLYPSSIRSINISPETLIGQFPNNVRAAEEIAKGSLVSLMLEYEDGSNEEHTADEWRDVLKLNKWAISGYGTVFTQEKKGIIPAILEDWYATRKKYQKLKAEADNKQDRAYYDRLQYVYKIKLNSLYGALNNQYFRYYDLRMGESTTGTGRAILRHQCAKANELMTGGEYDVLGEAVIYGDTDSTYFETWAENEEEALLVADTVAEKVNSSFQEFMRETFLCTEEFDNIIQAGREVVASRGIFVDKKRYILRVIDNEGEKVDKLKVMGLDTKKTTLPKEVSKKLNDFVGRYLRGEDWDAIANDIVEYKEELMNSNNYSLIGLPKGVQKVEQYYQEYKVYGDGVRLPGHVAASIFYNMCRDEYDDKDSIPIVSGMKIRVYYLTTKHGRFKSIALPTDLEQIPQWFLDNFTVDRDAHIQRLVDKPLGNIIKAIGKDVPSRQALLVDSLLDF